MALPQNRGGKNKVRDCTEKLSTFWRAVTEARPKKKDIGRRFETYHVEKTQICQHIKGGPEPLENEINKISGSKCEDRFSDHFSDLVQNIFSVRFSYLLRLSIV